MNEWNRRIRMEWMDEWAYGGNEYKYVYYKMVHLEDRTDEDEEDKGMKGWDT